MSLSKPKAKNPAQRFFEWKGGDGVVSYYDKDAQEQVRVKLPFQFLVLDVLTTVTGFSKADQSGFWSNEVRDIMSDQLVVRTKAGIKARGTWGDISENIKSKGAKYAASVYIAFKDESGELVIGNIKFSGASLVTWIEFNKKWNVEKCAVIISGSKAAKNGRNEYFKPVIEGGKMSAATRTLAIALDEQVQDYLEIYMSRKPDTEDTKYATSVDELEDQDDDEDDDTLADGTPVKQPKKAAPKKKVKKEDVEIEDLTDDEDEDDEEQINVADVPF